MEDRGEYKFQLMPEVIINKQYLWVCVSMFFFFLMLEMLATIVSEERITTTPNDSPGTEGITCRLDCTCGGAEVEWQASDGGPLPEGVSSSRSLSRRQSTLTFNVITFELAGEYICVARSNSQPDVVKTLSVEVLPPAMITVMPSETSVRAGEVVKLVCVANRDVVSFVWTYQTNELPLPSSATPTTVNRTVSELEIQNIQRNLNTGQYFCQGIFDQTGEMRSNTGNVVQISESYYKHNKLFLRYCN